MKIVIVSVTSFVVASTFWACGSVWDDQVSADTVNKVLPLIQSSDTLSEKKKKYLSEMIPMTAGLASIAGLAGKSEVLPTYREVFINFSRQYDSTAAVYKRILDNNQ